MTDQQQPEQVPAPACACGEPASPGIVHRIEGPCYFEQQPAPQIPPVPQPAQQQPRPLPILRYFDFTHLPEPLRQVSAEFASLAMYVADYLPPGPEQSVALRKLLEAKDAAVRAGLDLPKPVPQVRTGEVCCGGMAPSSATTIGVGEPCCSPQQQTNEEGSSHG